MTFSTRYLVTRFSHVALIALAMLILTTTPYPSLARAESMIEMGAAASNDSGVLYGGIWIAERGEIKIRWEGLSLQEGFIQLNVRADDGSLQWGGGIPGVVLNLGELLGKEWKNEIEFKVFPGSYDWVSPAAKVTDLRIGTIALSLSRSKEISEDIAGSIAVTLAGTGYLKREFLASNTAFEATPITLFLDGDIIFKLSAKASLTLAAGAFASAMQGYQVAQKYVQSGGYASTSLSLGDHFRTGAAVSAEIFQEITDAALTYRTFNATAYLKFLMGEKLNAWTARHALTLEVLGYSDEIIGTFDGTPREGVRSSLIYTLTF